MATTCRLNCCQIPTTNHDGHEHDHNEHNHSLAIGTKTNRVFTPSQLAEYGPPSAPPSDIVLYDSTEQICHLRHSISNTSKPKVEQNTLVISIDGKARREGSNLAPGRFWQILWTQFRVQRSTRFCPQEPHRRKKEPLSLRPVAP